MTFLAGFSKRKAIKIATAGIPASDLAAFPKLFEISGDTDIGGETTSQKLAVTLADGTTQVPYGALYFNVSGGAATLKIRAKFDLSHSWSNGDTIGYLYYDHAATDQSNKSGVLDANTVAYLPLEENPSGPAPQMKDWSSNAYDFTTANMISADSVTEQVGNGLSFDGAGKSASVSLTIPTTGSLSFNLQPFENGGTFIYHGFVCGDGNGTPGFVFERYSDSNIYAGWYPGAEYRVIVASSGNWDNTQFQRYCLTWVNGGDSKLYRNGSQIGATVTGTVTNAQALLKIGRSIGAFGRGTMGELFLRNDSVTGNYSAYDYTDQFSNSSTFTLGAEEVAGGGAVFNPYYYRLLAQAA